MSPAASPRCCSSAPRSTPTTPPPKRTPTPGPGSELPNGVFSPYTGIKTNLLFFTKGEPTKQIWFYEHPYPPGAKSYNKTKPIRIEEFDLEKKWWKKRKETEHAWKVPVEQVQAAGYNLDIKNPHDTSVAHTDPDELLADYQLLMTDLQQTRDRLKDELMKAFER